MKEDALSPLNLVRARLFCMNNCTKKYASPAKKKKTRTLKYTTKSWYIRTSSSVTLRLLHPTDTKSNTATWTVWKLFMCSGKLRAKNKCRRFQEESISCFFLILYRSSAAINPFGNKSCHPSERSVCPLYAPTSGTTKENAPPISPPPRPGLPAKAGANPERVPCRYHQCLHPKQARKRRDGISRQNPVLRRRKRKRPTHYANPIAKKTQTKTPTPVVPPKLKATKTVCYNIVSPLSMSCR